MVLKAIHGYDPEYSAKIRKLVMAIQNDGAVLMGDQIITAADYTLASISTRNNLANAIGVFGDEVTLRQIG